MDYISLHHLALVTDLRVSCTLPYMSLLETRTVGMMPQELLQLRQHRVATKAFVCLKVEAFAWLMFVNEQRSVERWGWAGLLGSIDSQTPLVHTTWLRGDDNQRKPAKPICHMYVEGRARERAREFWCTWSLHTSVSNLLWFTCMTLPVCM